MRRTNLAKLCAVALFAALGAFALFDDQLATRRAYARSAGPDPGFTGAPGEKKCDECHVPDAGSVAPGAIHINAPASYIPGQTYQLGFTSSNSDPTRARWGFQMTALDDNGNPAGTLAPLGDGLTHVVTGATVNPARQYIEHTQAGTFQGQTNGASWSFNWTAPATDAGPVTFYVAANQSNGDQSSAGDSITSSFVVVPPAAAQGDFALNFTPSTQVIIPGASATYTVTATPSGGFTGAISLSLAGLPSGATASFNPTSLNVTDASAKSSTLTVTNGAATPLGSFPLTAAGTSASLTHTAAATLVTGPTMTDVNLTVRQVVAGLNQPTTMAFLGNNDFLVLEKASGRVLRVTNGVVQSTPVLDLAVNNNSERGLLGIALHPQFPANPRVYLYWTESSTGADSANAADVPLLGNRVDSFLWNGSALALEKNLIRLRAFQQDAGQALFGNHNGGVIRFGADGKLYIVIGDNGRRGMMQNLPFGPSASPNGPTVADDQFGGPEPDNSHLTGVIIRLNDDGTTPTDNPFFSAQTGLTGEAAANVKKIFGYGVRNSFGMAFDPVSNYLWTEENGDDSFDEVNRVVPGFNGGWVQIMGPSSRVAQFKQIEVSLGNSLQQNRWTPDRIADTPADALARLFSLPGSRYTEPEFSWKFAVAPSPVGFVRGRGLGPAFEGDLLVGASRTTLAGGYLFRFKLSNDRRHLAFADARLADTVADNAAKFDLTESESLLVGRDFGITTDIESAPNGDVFVVSNTNGAVYEISAKPDTVQFASANFSATEDDTENAPRATVTVTRAGDTSGSAAVAYRTVDDQRPIPCNPAARDQNNNPFPQGVAFARCDYASTGGTLVFAPNETAKTFTVPVIDDGWVEPNETVQLELFNPSGASLGAQPTATLTITDNDLSSAANPIDTTDFFVRQQYLDFLSREPDPDGFNSWRGLLNNCPNPFNIDAASPSARCDRITVSANFYLSTEFQLKGFFVYRFYKLTLNRQPTYVEMVADMNAVTGSTAQEVFDKKAAFTNGWVQRQEFKNTYDAMTNAQFVNTLMDRYALPSVTTPNPASPDDNSDTNKVTLTRAALVSQLDQQSMTRAQVVRALADSNEVGSREFVPAFVSMQYFGYLRRDPDPSGYNDWINYLAAHPGDFRTMVIGFVDSPEYGLRFGPR
ncbi:MAG: PQQ-dependent sugar dehydrogenase [Acidobacteria bacterium]|nr:PQQ-dependent sugar dehydrogenase [Acidobacteriota bacterium]